MSSQEDNWDIFEVEIEASTFTPRPAEGVSLQKAREYLAKLKQFRPEEYEEIMKQREQINKEREAHKKQNPQ
jgi:hypothetical protein